MEVLYINIKEIYDKHKGSPDYIQKIHKNICTALRVPSSEIKVEVLQQNEKNKKNTKEKGVQCNTFKTYIKNIKKEMDVLLSEKENVEDSSNDIVQIERNLDFQEMSKGKPFNFKLRNLYYIFRSHNVGIVHIAPIIEAVLNLFNINVKKLPSKSTAAVLTSEMGVVSRNHLNEKLLTSDNTTMHRDATTKKGKHFYGVKLNTGEDIFTAGVREVCNGKSGTYINCTKEILNDLSSNECEARTILNSVSCFMTDRSATEQKVNDILSEEIPHEVHSFKCAVHPLIQFSDVCVEESFNIEKELHVNFNSYSNSVKEPFILCVLKSVSKMFYKDGVGDPKDLQVFMKSNGVENIPIINFRGSRFNVSFYNAAGTFFIHKLLLQYFFSLKTSYSVLQNFIVLSLQNKVILCLLRAFGILYKLITEPYFLKALEVGNILYMGSVYERLLLVLNMFYDDPSLALKQQLRLFYGPQFYDSVSDYLFDCCLHNDLTTVFLKRLCGVLKTKVEKIFSDFLSGGKYFNVNPDVLSECSSCISNNICLERLMGQLDFSLKTGPTSSINTIESSIIFNDNKTSEWLTEKDDSERQLIIENARKENKKFMELQKERKIKLYEEHLKILKEKEEETKRKRERQTEAVDKAIEDMREHGIWESREIIEKEVEKLKTKKEKLQALKTQINMYKKTHVLPAYHMLLNSKKAYSETCF
ncbi:uncharacterized protein LOC133186202 [Saccostrea echinata]|uniref:uncharacterized protein LOC133186202 n=1 Tax=Saccostrea echinata TaxID=191078 RepID=UPI002A827F96|nr:uncharacterized protein LOC133186202 [Saccostrea echinata]